jgi:type II secretory pathway pseudopilin PulG
MHKYRNQRGISLLEVIIAVGVIALLAGVLIFKPFSGRERATKIRQEKVFEAIMGSEKSQARGYLADMGRLPASLSELVEKGAQPDYTTSPLGSMGMGWRGPYITDGIDNSSKTVVDGWGTPFQYSANGGAQGQVISAGPDRKFGTGDDIAYPSKPLDDGVIKTAYHLTVKVINRDGSIDYNPPVASALLYVISSVRFKNNDGL